MLVKTAAKFCVTKASRAKPAMTSSTAASSAMISDRETLRILGEFWAICQLAVAAGLLIYALGYLARRPKIRVVAP